MSITTSQSIAAISKALYQFQGSVEGVEKDSKNPAFKSRYASLEAVRDTAVPHLQFVGVVFIQSAGAIVDGVMAMTTRLIHVESGEWVEGTMDICLGKRDPQGVGSAQTYAARYHLMAMLGLPPIDDDGEGAMDRSPSSGGTVVGRDNNSINNGLAASQGPANATKKLTAGESADLLKRLMEGIENQPADPAKLWEWRKSERVDSAVKSLSQDDSYRFERALDDAAKLASSRKAEVPPNFDNIEQGKDGYEK